MPRSKTLVLVTLFTALSTVQAGNWPRFRGPNGSGMADDKGVPVRFDDQSGLRWKVPLTGQGNSSPIVWGNNLFIQVSAADGTSRTLLCLDAGTGKTLWKQTIPAVKARTHPRNTLASSTPATDGQIVVTAFWDGKEVALAAFDFDGKALWNRNLGTFTSQHGAGASPIIFHDKIFFANDQDGISTLYALNNKTGDILWQAEREAFRACYSAPFILERQGPELIVTSSTSIRSYLPDSGTVNWSWNWKFTGKMPLRTTGSPIHAGGLIFACSGDGGGDRHMSALRPGSGNGQPPVTLWENKKDFPYVPTLLSRNGYLYFVNDKGFAGCYIAQTGRRVWHQRLPDTTFTSSPVLIDGKMYAASEEGDLYVFAAEPAYRLLGRSTIGERVRASLAVANNCLYIRGQHHLFCIGKNGK